MNEIDRPVVAYFSMEIALHPDMPTYSGGFGMLAGDCYVQDADLLYEKLQNVVIPRYYKQRDAWLRIMSHAIALNASYFNTQRMMQKYVLKAYYE